MRRNQYWQGFQRRRLFLLVALALVLVASSCRKKQPRAPTPPPVVATPSPAVVTTPPPAVVVAPPPTAAPSEEVGLASWYGRPYHGRRTANGEVYDMEKLTAAHRTLAFDSWVRVRNLDNGSTVNVRINDRGPFVDGRVIDLSKAAARTIEMIGPGTALVRVERIATPRRDSSEDVPWYGVQAGAFAVVDNAEQLSETLNVRFGAAQVVMSDGDPPVWQVIVGEFSSRDAAEALARQIRTEFGAAFVTRLAAP